MKTTHFKIIFALAIVLFFLQPAGASPRLKEIIKDTEYLSIYPIPIQSKGILKITIDTPSDIKIEFFDLSGKKVKEIKKENFDKGVHLIKFTTLSLKQGIYICKVSTNTWIKATRIRISQ